MTSERGAQREPLTLTVIVTGGIEIADAAGVDTLKMRALAEHLGFKVMALYNHVSNKEELLTLMVDAVAATIEEPDPAETPLVAVRGIAMATRAMLVQHPWASELWMRHLPGPARIRSMETLLRLLANSGLSPELAHHGFHAVTNHVLGYTLQEIGMTIGMTDPEATIQEFLAQTSEAETPHVIKHVHQHMNGDWTSSFELVLDLIIDGLVGLDQQQS